MRGYVIARAQIALIWLATLCAFTPTLATAAEAPVNILFVGNSFTHGRYEPVRTYNAGFGTDTVHDLLCPSLAACSSAEQGSQIDPAETPAPGTTLPATTGLSAGQSFPAIQRARPLWRDTRNFPTVHTRGTPPLFSLRGCGEQRNADRVSQQYWQRER